ncbi:isocitrate lyase/phosphoenolpyruvate mutase family protein, partial [Streptomyces sp. SID5785]|nr:isocitrate lyase/phosphoenolpyruvate mutase family protein [Streptomyces sp. SID5785]
MTHTTHTTNATHTTHTVHRLADVRAALADPALVPDGPAPTENGPRGASVAWLRATVARFSSGEPHRRRRALVEGELARLAPDRLRRCAAAGAEGETRVRVVRALAEAWGMPSPEAVARDVPHVAAAYFGGTDDLADADAAVTRLVAR